MTSLEGKLKFLRKAIEEALGVLDSVELESASTENFDGDMDFYKAVEKFEMSMIKHALRVWGNQTRAASLLGLNLSTLNCKMKAYCLRPIDNRIGQPLSPAGRPCESVGDFSVS